MGVGIPPRRRVLIVGDSPGLCTALARGLRHPELDVRTAEGATRAFAALSRETVDFVIAELSLPPSGGVDFLEVVKLLHPQSQRVLITGECDIALIRDAINRSGVSYFLGKPWDAHSLHELVRSVLLIDDRAGSTPSGDVVELDAEFYARSVRDGLQGVSHDILPGHANTSRTVRPASSGSLSPNRMGSASIRKDGAETLKLNDLARDLLGASAIRKPALVERK